jgi:preprotein translocase subunit SecD
MKKLFGLFLLCFVLPAFSETLPQSSDYFLSMQVIQDKIIFDYSTVKSASLIEQDGVFKGLFLELKASAANSFQAMTTANIGKHLDIVFNKKIVASSVIQTSLGEKILITGVTKEDAQAFINMLRLSQQEEMKKREADADGVM